MLLLIESGVIFCTMQILFATFQAFSIYLPQTNLPLEIAIQVLLSIATVVYVSFIELGLLQFNWTNLSFSILMHIVASNE